jgi:ribosome-associated heat shock protein Hsp15
MERLRIDKWLWAARFYKTRTLASDEIDRGRVRVNGVPVKPARELKAGDLVEVRIGTVVRGVVVNQ